MAKIVSKLDLNKTPQIVDNNSLIFAKNIRVLPDGTIGPDLPIDNLTSVPGIILGYIVGLDSTIYLFVGESTLLNYIQVTQFYTGLVPTGGVLTSYRLSINNEYTSYVYNWEEGQDLGAYVSSMLSTTLGGKVVRQAQVTRLATHYPFTTTFDVDWTYTVEGEEGDGNKSEIYSVDSSTIVYNIYAYNELEKTLTKIDSAWTWSGGKIHGVCTTNNTGDTILTVCEYFDDGSKLVPIKHINLSHADVNDETLYTQTPNIPFTNLNFIEYYTNPIPNGVYQFFIRYKIYKDFYTSWFPCSGECFAGTKNVTNTIQGSIQYVDTTLNSNESFVFEVEHLLNENTQYESDYTKNFKEFQIGFIVAHDDSINARSWKHFPMDIKRIYFDYDQAFIEEINIDDLLKSVYEISNVKNITYFRNKLYIANYVESNINEDLSGNAFDVDCELVQQEIFLNSGNLSEQITINNKTYSAIADTSPILYDLGTDKEQVINKIVRDTITTPLSNNEGLIYRSYCKAYPSLKPDQLFLKSGYDCSTINNDPLEPEYTNPNILKTFCLVNTNDAGYFYKINFYNNQKPDNSSNASRLVYENAHGLGDGHYMRVLGEEDTNQVITINNVSKNIYIHPLNDSIDWFCGSCHNSDIKEKNENFIRYGSASGYYLIGLKQPNADYSGAYSIHFQHPDWDDGDECKNWDIAAKCINEEILDYIRNNYPKYVLKSIKLYSNNAEIALIDVPSSTVTRTISNMEGESEITITSKTYNDFRGIPNTALDEDFIEWCTNYVSSNVIDGNGNAYYLHNSEYKKIDRVEIIYNEFSYELGDIDTEFLDNGGLDNGEQYTITTDINASVKRHSTIVYYDAKNPTVAETGISPKINTRSLLPFTDYKFYIHYIKSTGVITNGYQIGNTYSLDAFDETLEHSVIYPRFDNITLPDGYIGYFFSVEKVGDDIASCFNVRTTDNERIVDCLEIDSMLYPLTDNITILNSNGKVVTKKAKYYPSSTTNPAMLLGNVGCIRWKLDDEYDSDSDSSDDSSVDESTSRYWVRIIGNYESSTTNRLIKLTPYLNSGNFGYNANDYDKYNIPGYYCSVCKPIDVQLVEGEEIYLYVNGSDLYEKKMSDDALEIEDHDALMTHIDTYNLTPYYVYSNFNLNYLTLFDMSYKQVKYKRCLIKDEDTDETIETKKQMLFMLDSSTISYIYTLPSMYKDYTRKLYNSLQTDKLYIFDNVIRSSDANTDETYKYIYNFDALDYYTVPANKGKIINLFNITQNIFIHCEHSLFKFSGDNTLTARDTEVQLTENDIFDTGIIELFDSEHGFAGLQVKHQSLVTYNAYVFYDNFANALYAYFGENNVVKLSNDIYKILKNKDFTDVLFNADEENDRFFINFVYSDYSNICLSYNYNTKSFVSIHDFTFEEGFSTRTGCYFLNFGKVNLFNISNVFLAVNSTTSYSRLYVKSKLFVKDMSIPEAMNSDVENCLDIVCNIEYEKVKLLNYINWICNKINQYADNENGVNLFVAEENISKYAGSKLRIYSDQCSTALINLEDNNGHIYEQNTQALTNATSYEYPRYNCGVWTLNYFRDIKNIEDIFNYKDAIPPTQQEEASNTGLVNSDRSLIYGKYFVLRLIFKSKNFKLENINFNIQDYEKV